MFSIPILFHPENYTPTRHPYTYIHTQKTHLIPQMITSHTIFPTTKSISFTLHNVNFPSGKTSSQTTQRVKAIQSIISFLNNLDFWNRQLIKASDFNLVLNSIDKTGYFHHIQMTRSFFQKLITNFDQTDSYRYFYPYAKIIFSFL